MFEDVSRVRFGEIPLIKFLRLNTFFVENNLLRIGNLKFKPCVILICANHQRLLSSVDKRAFHFDVVYVCRWQMGILP